MGKGLISTSVALLSDGALSRLRARIRQFVDAGRGTGDKIPSISTNKKESANKKNNENHNTFNYVQYRYNISFILEQKRNFSFGSPPVISIKFIFIYFNN